MESVSETRVNRYGQLAFAGVVVAAFAPILFRRDLSGEVSQWVVAFGLGATYGVLGVLGNQLCPPSNRLKHRGYFVVQAALATAILIICPLHALPWLIVLPLAAQAVFELGWVAAVVVNGWAYGTVIGVLHYYYGFESARSAAVSLFSAFAFTGLFAVLTRHALTKTIEAERLSAELMRANTELEATAAQREELATTRERNRVAREIHDGVGHYLTVIKVQLDAAAALLEQQPAQSRRSVETAARLAGEALEDVRRSVGSLRADAASRPPLLSVLRQLTENGEPVADVVVVGEPRPLTTAMEHAFFRAAQEGLTNVRKHAGATKVSVALDFRHAQHVRLQVTDNGLGRVPDATTGGVGLRGLSERVELLGGRMHAESPAGGGFVLCVELPA